MFMGVMIWMFSVAIEISDPRGAWIVRIVRRQPQGSWPNNRHDAGGDLAGYLNFI